MRKPQGPGGAGLRGAVKGAVQTFGFARAGESKEKRGTGVREFRCSIAHRFPCVKTEKRGSPTARLSVERWNECDRILGTV